MPCFLRPETLIQEIRTRLNPVAGAMTARDSIVGSMSPTGQSDFFELADRIIRQSSNSFYTDKYDTYQYMTLGIQK